MPGQLLLPGQLLVPDALPGQHLLARLLRRHLRLQGSVTPRSMESWTDESSSALPVRVSGDGFPRASSRLGNRVAAKATKETTFTTTVRLEHPGRAKGVSFLDCHSENCVERGRTKSSLVPAAPRCHQAIVGFYGAAGAAATPCPANSYCEQGTERPVACPSGTQSTDLANDVTDCVSSPGYYGPNGKPRPAPLITPIHCLSPFGI